MKYNFLIFGICLSCLFIACEPDFNLNAPYKDVPVVYGVLNYQDTIHYVKIYKGFLSNEKGTVFIDAQNPDSIYYYNDITAVLEEFDENDKRTLRASIPLYITHDFPRDSGIFYYDKERIIYHTKESINPKMSYNIKITNKFNGNITQGKTKIVGDFRIANMAQSITMLEPTSIVFTYPPNAAKNGYEIYVNFIYFEVDNKTHEVKTFKIVKNISPQMGGEFKYNEAFNEIYKSFTPTFYDDIAVRVKPNPNVTRYMGSPGTNGVCIEIEGWAAGDAMYNYLLSNKPTSSFVQVNTRYTNLIDSVGMAFGFFSSRIKTPVRKFTTTTASQDSLVSGSKTAGLGFRPWIEYKP